MNKEISTKEADAEKPDMLTTQESLKQLSKELKLAVVKGNIERVRECLTNPLLELNVNAFDRERNITPLHHATIRGHYETVKLLLENGADVTVTAFGQYCTPLHYIYHCLKAPTDKKLAIMKLLLSYGAASALNNKDHSDNNSTILHYAASKGDLRAARLFIKHGSDVNATDSRGKTPLHYAILALRHSEEVQKAIERIQYNSGDWFYGRYHYPGIDKESNGNQEKKESEVCEENKSSKRSKNTGDTEDTNNYNNKDNYNKSSNVVDIEISKTKYTEIIKLLLKKGADAKLCNNKHHTSLREVLSYMDGCNCSEIVRLLRDKKVI